MSNLGQLYPALQRLWLFLIFTVVVDVLLNLASSGLTGGPWTPTPAARQFLSAHFTLLVILTLLLVELTILSFNDSRNRIDVRLSAVATVKRVEELSPGLRSDNADVTIADYRPETYLARDTDQDAAQALADHGCLVVIGRPLSGKTRTAWEQFRMSPEAVVVIPREDRPPEFTADGLRGRDVILFIDDLHLVAPTIDLNGWIIRLENANPHSLQVVCTARDGADWVRVEEHQGRFVRRFGPQCYVYTSRGVSHGEDFTTEEGEQLAALLNLKLSDEAFNQRFDGTLGSLTLNLVDMGTRYEALRREQLNGVQGSRLVDSLKLLHRGGQPRLREDIVRAVAESIRGNEPLSNETWEALQRRTEEEGFGVFEEGLFQTYRPYLENPVCASYEPSPEELATLVPLMINRRDFEGLFYLGAEAQALNNQELAKQAYQASADGGFGWAANNLGTMLMSEGRIDDAEIALNRAISVGAELAHGNLGLLLSNHTDRFQEAEEAFRAGAAKGVANASFGLGNHLAKQPGREADAEKAFREAIDRGEKHALLNLGNLIKDLPGRRGEARQLVSAAIDAGVNEAYNSLGVFLWEEGDRGKAEEAFKRSAESGVADSYFNLGKMLSEDSERWEVAEKSYQNAIERGLDGAHFSLGNLLLDQEGRESDAAEEFRMAIDAGEQEAHHRYGIALARMGRTDDEVEKAFRDAIAGGDLAAVNSLGALLSQLSGREDEAEKTLRQAATFPPTRAVAEKNLGLLLRRVPGREKDAEQAFLAAAMHGEEMAYLHLGRLLLKSQDRRSDACAALQRANAAGISEAAHLLAEHCQGRNT